MYPRFSIVILSGVFCDSLNLEEYYRLPDECSVYQAELLAIKKAVELIAMREISNADISFYIDNQAAILSLRSAVLRSKLVDDCRRVLSNSPDIIVSDSAGFLDTKIFLVMKKLIALQKWDQPMLSRNVNVCLSHPALLNKQLRKRPLKHSESDGLTLMNVGYPEPFGLL